MADDVDKIYVGDYIIKFDEETINDKLDMDTYINFPGEALLLEPNEMVLQDAHIGLCVRDAEWRFTPTRVSYLLRCSM